MKAIEELRRVLTEAQKPKEQVVKEDSKSAILEFRDLLAEAQKAMPSRDENIELPKLSMAEELVAPIVEEDIASLTAKYLSASKGPDSSTIEANRWDDPLRREAGQNFVTVKEMQDHYGQFLGRIQQQLSSLGGGGEVRLQRLDDVNYLTIANDRFLQYDAPSKKFILVKLDDDYTTQVNENNTISVINLPNTVVGPIQGIQFDTTHEHEGEEVGTLCWNPEDDTMNIQHSNGVVQQVGQELYAYVRNGTANTIINGTAVRFDGAEENGTSRLLVAPFLADGSYPSLYGLGIATSDIEPGADGKVTVWGKVRDLDTSAWNVGDILYVSPSIAGGLTNIKPTAPNNVIPLAAVLRSDEAIGEIFVRPTIEQQQYYGRFARTTTQTANTINTAYPIEFDDTEISNGVSIGTPTSRIVVIQSGFYQFDLSIQAAASSNKGVVYVWFRKGNQSGSIDVPKSSRSNTVTNGDSFTISTSLQISLDAGEYVEAVWAASAAGITLSANQTPVIGPSVASALLSVGQIQL